MNGIVVSMLVNTDLDKIYKSGQCFGIEKLSDGEYAFISGQRFCLCKNQGTENSLLTCYQKDIGYWHNYFNTSQKTKEVKKLYKELYPSTVTTEVCAVSDGLRLLRQDFIDCLLSFITVQRRSVKQGYTGMKRLRDIYGTKIDLETILGASGAGKSISLFPTLAQLRVLTEKDFSDLGFGYRSSYLFHAVQGISNGAIVESNYRGLTLDKAVMKLKYISGVGDKTANCVALYSLGYEDAYPRDVHILNFERDYCNGHFKEELFGTSAGLVQLWQYYYMRNA